MVRVLTEMEDSLSTGWSTAGTRGGDAIEPGTTVAPRCPQIYETLGPSYACHVSGDGIYETRDDSLGIRPEAVPRGGTA